MNAIGIAAIVTAFFGGGGLISYLTVRLTNRTDNRKVDLEERNAKTDGAEQVQGMALALLEPLQARLKSAEAEVDSLRLKIADLVIAADRANDSARAAHEEARAADERTRAAELERDAYKAQAEARYPGTDPHLNDPTNVAGGN